MNRTSPRALRAVVAALALFVLPASAYADIDQEAAQLATHRDAARYRHPTTAPPSRIDTGGAAVLVDAPIDVVRRVVSDYRHYVEIIPTFSQARVLSRRAGRTELYLEVPVMHGALSIWAVAKVDAPKPDGAGEAIEARMTKGNVTDFRATWRLRAVDATHTVLKLELLVDPNLPAPRSLVESELESAADVGATAVRNRAEALAREANVAEAAARPAPPT